MNRPAPTRPPHLATRTLRSLRGFTILEVALAAAIMALGISTSIPVMQRAFALLDSARNLTTAGQILVSQMEQLRMFDWTTVSAYPTAETTLTIDSSFTGNSSVGNRFTLKRTVTTTTNPEIIEITYSISWRTVDGRTLSRSMNTYYARYGIHDYYYNNT